MASTSSKSAGSSFNSLEKVTKFLIDRGVEDYVINNFQSEKMDICAVANAPEAVLERLGLTKAGDRLNLIAYCKNFKVNNENVSTPCEESAKKKRELLEAFLSRNKVSKTSRNNGNISSSQGKDPAVLKNKTKKVQLGWKHFREEDNEYVLVPLAKGGGSRTIDAPININRFDLQNICKDLFFPLGQSLLGNVDDMLIELSNFKDEKVNEFIKVGDRLLPFNIHNYMDAYKIKTVRIYLRTKNVSIHQDSDEELDDPVFDDEDNAALPDITKSSSLIGTSEDRNALINKQNDEYQKSLNLDVMKSSDHEKENEEKKTKERIQSARQARVPPEPSNDFLAVKIRHPFLGIQSRRFSQNTLMNVVYDWAGSLCADPTHFTLNDPLGNILSPSSVLYDKSTLNMVQSLETPPLTESDDEVQFLGFGKPISIRTDNSTENRKQPSNRDIVVQNQKSDRWLDTYYASLLETSDSVYIGNCEDADSMSVNSNPEIDTSELTADDDNVLKVDEILRNLTKEIDYSSISKFNIARGFIWEGTKRALSRKSFSPNNKVSVKFTDDAGNSEGAVDMGGPMKEFFTLVTEWMLSSQLFCGPEHDKFLSCQAQCIQENEYYFAGTIIAMSLVNGGPGPQCLAPKMFKAIVRGPDSVVIDVDDVYDREVQACLKSLEDAATTEEARAIMFDEKIMTILDLAGTLRPIKTTADSKKIAALTAKWYVLGRANVSLVSFENGLSVLGVLDAVKKSPNAFQTAFCYSPMKLDVETLDDLFRVVDSPTGSNKAVAESLVLSRWRDYLQDIEEGDEPICLNDILFFATGLRVLPPRKIYPSIEFLHESETCGKKSRFPKANTCADILRLPVVHTSYEAFKVALEPKNEFLCFGIFGKYTSS